MGDLLDYIISMGHKKIAYIHGQDFSSVTRDRLAAYYRALENHGIDIPEEYVRVWKQNMDVLYRMQTLITILIL